ncbi:hypothetical protein ACP70R_001819 [Stipagrostis hirtigluma subsp. patula]
MGVLLLSLLSFLVAVAGGGGSAAVATSVGDSTVSYYSSASDVIAYWQTVLPKPIPPAIMEHFSYAGNNKINLGLGHQTSRVEGDDQKVTLQWGLQTNGDDGGDEKTTLGWGQLRSGDEGGGKKITLGWGQRTSGDVRDGEKASLGWSQQTSGDGGDKKVTLEWGQRTSKDLRDDEKATLGWSQQTSTDEREDKKITLGWGQHKNRDEGDDGRVTHQWGRRHINGDYKKVTIQCDPDDRKFPSRSQSSCVRDGQSREMHRTGHNHGPFNFANILFSEAELTPGTMVTPYIEPSVLPTPFLRRDVADSIPMSTNNFTDVLSKFAPASFAMAGRIWSTLHTCEHPHPLEGERQACATSIESMAELAMSVVGTREVLAFSSSADVPAEGLAPPPSRKYTVAAVRAVTAPAGEPATTMTCHGLSFPYAVFYCHAVNPTRVYEVTLRRSTEAEEDGATAVTPQEMRVLAVCHLDTSRFDPKNPYFVARGLKPGDAAVCHFLSRDSVVWAAAASAPGQGQVAAQ